MVKILVLSPPTTLEVKFNEVEEAIYRENPQQHTPTLLKDYHILEE